MLNARLAVLTNTRWRAVSAAAGAVVIVLAAFAWRGPIGIGNGPPVRSLTGCVQPVLAPATGYAIPAAPPTAAHGPGLVIELAGPATAQCAVLTKIVLHYHVGIRHYAGSYPQGTVSICAPYAHLPPGSLAASPGG